MKYYIAIDGGGTKTDGILANEHGHVLARRRTGATNPNDIGIDEACSRLVMLSTALAANAAESITALCAGIAGAGNHRDELRRAFCDAFPYAKIAVVSDAENLLCSELPEGDGCCIISGTGSVCFVRRGDSVRRIGGWGWLIDSGGSGYNIGRDALEAALTSHDGRGTPTLITGHIVEKLGGTPWDKLSEIYAGGKPLISSLASAVFDADEEGDVIAGRILWRNMTCISEYLDAAYAFLKKPFRAVLGGGIFENHPVCIEMLRDMVKAPAQIITAEREQVFGAFEQAKRL